MIRLVPATAGQKPLVANLIQLYLHDMTESMPFPIGPDGRFQYDFLERFWQFPYLIYSGDEIAGFALVIEQCPLTQRSPCFFMAEFFILKGYRRRGLGQSALAAIADRHPGDWHVGVPKQNIPAQEFWFRALGPYAPTTRDISFEGDDWHLHAFSA